MNRREAVRAATVLVGGALAASTGMLAACAPDRRPPPRELLDADDEALVAAIADTLLPTTTASPGARAAGVAPVIDLLLTDCRDQATQERVVAGLEALRRSCREECSAPFAALSRAERERLLRQLDAEAQRAGGPHWFADLRELALQAYFTSEVGMTRALRYVRVPGRWMGCVPREPGQPAWG